MNIPLFVAYATMPTDTVRSHLRANVYQYQLLKVAPVPNKGTKLNMLRVYKEAAREASRVLARRVSTVGPGF